MRIGIPAQNQPEGKFGVNTNYLDFISQFGNPIIILPIDKEEYFDVYNIDALVLPGGQDVNPARYNKIGYQTGSSNIFLEYFDTQILPLLVGKVPIFGICRGLQTLNVYFGGTLKNLWWHPYSNTDIDEVHKIRIRFPNGKNKDKMGVNSFHHQAIDRLADNFNIEAVADELLGIPSGVVEAISDLNRNIFAVQWHPERLMDQYSFDKFNLILKG